MRKTVITLMLVLFAFCGFSQAKVAIGVKAGANFANTNISGSESITAFHGGLFGLVKVTKFGIQPEILFSKQGADEVNLDYVNIPVMFKYYLPLGLNLQAGPQFGVLLSAEDQDGTDLQDFLKGNDLSAAVGAGWDAPFGLQFTARYIIGLSDIDDGLGQEVKNRTFQLAVGYSLFKLGK